MADGWRDQQRLARRRHRPVTKRTHTPRLHFTHQLELPALSRVSGLALSSLLPRNT